MNLTALKLQLWQREQGFKRPYDSVRLSRELIQRKLGRSTLSDADIEVLSKFLTSTPQKTVEIRFLSCCSSANLFQSFRGLQSITLQSVDLSFNDLNCLLECVGCQLKSLGLPGNAFSEAHAEVLRQFLVHNRTLKFLDVSWCLNHHTLAVVADGVYKSKSLIGLDVSHLTVVVDGRKIAALIAILVGKKQLQELYLRSCGLDDLRPLNEYLEQPNPLQVLDVSNNSLGKLRFY